MDISNQDYIKKLAERHQKQLERTRKYNKDHREEQNAKSRAYFQKIKEDPEKYKRYLEYKRQRYKLQNPKPVLPVKEFE